jgi:sigma-B regulation protein RsbU (phosphoserine phosphatase)
VFAPRQGDLETLAEIGRSILEASLDEDQLCELIYQLAGQIVPTSSFQLGLFEGDCYQIKVWVKDGRRQPLAAFVTPAGQGIIGWMRATRQPLLVHDFLTEMAGLPAQPTYISDQPPRSALFLPMLIADGVIGAISIQSQEPNSFDEGHLRLLAILANQSASALNNARLYARGQRRLNALTAVAEVGRKLTSILDLNQLLTQVVELIQSRFGYYHAQIFLVERGRDGAYFKASSGGHQLNEKWQREGRSTRIGQEGIIGWVAQHGEHLLANDVSLEPRYIPDDPHLLPDTRAELAVPLIMEGEVLGVLDVQSSQTESFGQDDLFILSTLADQVAVAVNSARAYESQREEAWVTTVMLQVAEAASQAEGIQEVLDATARVTAMLAGVESCTTWLWDEDAEVFRYGAHFGFDLDPGVDPHQSLRFAAGHWPALDRLRAEKTPVVIAPAKNALPEPLCRVCPGDSVALLPMLNKGQVFGVMGVSFHQGQTPELNERRLSMLSGIAHQAAAAVDNSRLAAAREEEVWISSVLLQIAETISRLQPVEITLAQVARLVPAVTGVDRCAILLRDEEGVFRVRAAYAEEMGADSVFREVMFRPGDLPLLDDACRLGQPLLVEDVRGNPRVPATWQERYGSCTLLVVPLLVADEPVGAFLADDVDATHFLSPRRVRILAGIANQTAVAIENARLQAQEAERVRMSRELELAHDIQQNLLPQETPILPGYQIEYRWRSASEVGGDFFDFVPLGDDRLGIVLADVSDKGVPAALYMMFARTLMRAAAFSGREPAEALARTNEIMLADSRSEMFVTAYYSTLDADKHLLTYASAGHNLAIHVPASGGAPTSLITEGIPLGVLYPAPMEQKALTLAPGDVVLFYTDGVTEAVNAVDEEFGEERLAEIVCAQRAQPAEAIANAIESAVRGFTGDRMQFDDFTLVLVKRNN